MCCKQNTVNLTTTSKQLCCHADVRLRRRDGKSWGRHFAAYAFWARSTFILFLCKLRKVILSRGSTEERPTEHSMS